ncbi:MAG: aspartate kinase [Acidobacteria bacterium]|nr:aspartate kinase [Acidobacteriota bacterium]
MTLTILKFGGSSVGSADALRRAVTIVRSELPSGGLVVVSALKGTTDDLLEAARAAGSGDLASAKAVAARIQERHTSVASELGLEAEVKDAWASHFHRLHALLDGMSLFAGGLPRVQDELLAVGETLSARLVAALLQRDPSSAYHRDAREVLRTDGRHGAARPQLAATRRAALPWKQELERGALLVTQGFIAQGPDGATTTLGRGGSDTSATLLGEALGASAVQIWTDVDGVLSADPSLVPSARPLSRLSQDEAVALSGFGAKVLHADSLAPAARAGFRLIIANTLKPGASRTEVLRHRDADGEGPVSVTYKEGLTRLRWPLHAKLPDVLTGLQDLDEAGASRYGFQSGPEGHVLALRADGAAQSVLARLEEEGAEAEGGWAVIALVGESLRRDARPAFDALAELGTAPGAVLASGGVAVAFLVKEDALPALIPSLHARCVRDLEAAI